MRTWLDRNHFSSSYNGQVAAHRVTGLIIILFILLIIISGDFPLLTYYQTVDGCCVRVYIDSRPTAMADAVTPTRVRCCSFRCLITEACNASSHKELMVKSTPSITRLMWALNSTSAMSPRPGNISRAAGSASNMLRIGKRHNEKQCRLILKKQRNIQKWRRQRTAS